MLMAPRSDRLPTMETTANRVCSARNPMPYGALPSAWQHPETRIETRPTWNGTYQAEACIHCGMAVGARS